MEVTDGIKEEGTEVMPTAIPDPPEIGGVEATRTNKGNPSRNAGIVVRKATRRASAGRTAPIRTIGSGSGSGNVEKGNWQRSHYAEGSEKVGRGHSS